MQQRFEPNIDMTNEQTMLQAMYYDLRGVKDTVDRIEKNVDKDISVLATRTDALEGRLVDLEKFRFGVQMMAGPLWGVALLGLGAAITAMLKMVFHF